MEPQTTSTLRYQPAAVIGALTTALGLVGAALVTATDTSGAVHWPAFVIAILPFASGLAIKARVVSRPWLQDTIRTADTVLDALRPVAAEVDAPVPPADGPGDLGARRL